VLNLPRIRQRRIPGPLSSSDPQSPEDSSEGAGPDLDPNRSEPAKRRRQSGQDEDSGGFWRSILITLALALGIRQFLVEARFIPSGSMLPGLQLQDRLLVEKLTYRSRQPRRGEIVVFHAPHHFDPVLKQPGQGGPLNCLLVNLPVIGSLSGLQQPACDAYIKRVIGLPGERVSVNPRGQVSINGTPLAEAYVKNYCPVDRRGMGPCRSLDITVPSGHVLVLGDNRANSWDGRFWPGGPFLPQSEIIGRAFWRFFPFNAMGPLGASSSQDR
jgi:signal peptidase I